MADFCYRRQNGPDLVGVCLNRIGTDNFFKAEIAGQLNNEFPSFDGDIWHGYNNPIEIKRVCNNWNVFPPTTYKTFAFLNSQLFLDFLSEWLLKGIRIYSDPGLNGGGWHIHKNGGKLNTHLDYSLHPKMGLQRKLNIIIYINHNWQKNWGGALGLWGNESPEKPGNLISSIWCKFNRAIIFDTTQNSWHGLPEHLICPEDEARKSIAAYFLCETNADVDTRGKALFAPTKEQENDEKILEIIKRRSSIATASDVYESK